MKKAIVLLFLPSFFLSCTTPYFQKKGEVSPKSIDYNQSFTTNKSVVILPFKMDGELKNFMFDTGADYSVINREQTKGRTTSIKGSTGTTARLGNETVKSLKIGDFEFLNTHALNGNLNDLGKQVSNFGGIIGQPVILKANWLIDYPAKRIQISSKPIEIGTGFEIINVNTMAGANCNISIDGETRGALIDLGSSSVLTIPESFDLASILLKKYTFKDNQREVFSIGDGVQTINEKVATVPLVKIGNIEFKDVVVNIRKTSNLKIGNDFFKDHQLYIDNTNKVYKVKKVR
jgi:predicted aspartyl protease